MEDRKQIAAILAAIAAYIQAEQQTSPVSPGSKPDSD